MLWKLNGEYHVEPYAREADLEAAVREVHEALFGPSRIYLDVKRRIGATGRTTNIPDGYLLDLSSTKQPLLHIVENELAAYDPLRHIVADNDCDIFVEVLTPWRAVVLSRQAND